MDVSPILNTKFAPKGRGGCERSAFDPASVSSTDRTLAAGVKSYESPVSSSAIAVDPFDRLLEPNRTTGTTLLRLLSPQRWTGGVRNNVCAPVKRKLASRSPVGTGIASHKPSGNSIVTNARQEFPARLVLIRRNPSPKGRFSCIVAAAPGPAAQKRLVTRLQGVWLLRRVR